MRRFSSTLARGGVYLRGRRRPWSTPPLRARSLQRQCRDSGSSPGGASRYGSTDGVGHGDASVAGGPGVVVGPGGGAAAAATGVVGRAGHRPSGVHRPASGIAVPDCGGSGLESTGRIQWPLEYRQRRTAASVVGRARISRAGGSQVGFDFHNQTAPLSPSSEALFLEEGAGEAA